MQLVVTWRHEDVDIFSFDVEIKTVDFRTKKDLDLYFEIYHTPSEVSLYLESFSIVPQKYNFNHYILLKSWFFCTHLLAKETHRNFQQYIPIAN